MKLKAAALIAVLTFLSITADASTTSSNNGPSFETQVVTKTKTKTKYVVRRTKRGGKWVYVKTRVTTRPARHKTWRTGRKVVSRTKKIIS
jgi:hypothetical protein